MSLIKTSDELKQYFSSIDKDYKIASLQSFINSAETDILIPWIGYDLYNALSTAYNGAGLAGKQLAVFPYIQKAVTHLAFMLAADSGAMRIGDSGFYVITSQTNKPVSDKKMSQFLRGRREAGYNAMEQATLFMEMNINADELAVYKNSRERQQHVAYFINSSVDFTSYFKKVNNSAYLFSMLSNALDRAERQYIAPVLGAAYYSALKAKVADNSFTPAEQSLLPYINRALANYTIGIGISKLPVEFDGTNLVINSQPAFGNAENVENKAAATAQQLADLAGSAMLDGEFELRALEDYLVANAGSLEGYTPPVTTGDININCPRKPTFFV